MSDESFAFVLLCLLSIVTIGIMYKWSIPSLKGISWPDAKLAVMSPLIGFLIFLGACAFIPPWMAKLIHYTDTHGYSSFSKQEQDGLSQLVALLVSAILLVGFSRIHAEEIRETIWGHANALKAIGKGVLYCVLTYPIVMALVQGIHLALVWLGQKPFQEELALSQLKSIESYPWLFWSFAVATVSLVPLVEEFLFRGLFQNYLGGLLGPKISIFFTSLLFSFFHYAAEQGSSNVELMFGLFLYSFFIGIFYIKERSLWTAMTMHASFNAITLFFMFYVLK